MELLLDEFVLKADLHTVADVGADEQRFWIQFAFSEQFRVVNVDIFLHGTVRSFDPDPIENVRQTLRVVVPDVVVDDTVGIPGLHHRDGVFENPFRLGVGAGICVRCSGDDVVTERLALHVGRFARVVYRRERRLRSQMSYRVVDAFDLLYRVGDELGIPGCVGSPWMSPLEFASGWRPGCTLSSIRMIAHIPSA